MNTQLSPYLTFESTAEEAMRYYQSIFGGELTIQHFDDAPQDVTKDLDAPLLKRVLHAELKSENFLLYASDCMPGASVTMGDSVTLNIMTGNTHYADLFAKLAEKGTVIMPLEKQFWGDTYGLVRDTYGIQWSVNITSSK